MPSVAKLCTNMWKLGVDTKSIQIYRGCHGCQWLSPVVNMLSVLLLYVFVLLWWNHLEPYIAPAINSRALPRSGGRCHGGKGWSCQERGAVAAQHGGLHWREFGPFIVIILAILSQGEATCGLISNRNRLLLDLVTAVHGQAVVMFKCTRLQSKWMQMKVWRHFNALPQCNARNRFPTGKVRGRCGNQVKISHPLRSKNKLKLRPKPKRRKRLGNVDRDGIGWNGLVLFGTVCQFKCLKVSWVYIFRESTDKSEPMLQHARN